ncbi:MAG: hypothetical protein K8T91_01175 [Planctomycetes bacterium]|nr:hypothetical protein [Planctomycetota bacterium]
MPRFLPMLLVACWVLPCSLLGAAEPKTDTDFVVKAAPYKTSDFVAVRLQTTTGKAWYVKAGNWQPTSETEALPQGRYDLQLVSTGHPDQSSWFAFRTNLDTGKTWRLVSGKWQLMQTLTDE